ncbi:Hypothetical protein FKW44_001518 [Caligus rogercresseyi]|uniref:Uncharacterized protein n=1 Tax=Caligus rogercresseyi TaxID=217165 RepID=A0A7T8KIV7_CALRO|nr:Hypothetical protein FKW44_001518 [Caligus rogercresseyi]
MPSWKNIVDKALPPARLYHHLKSQSSNICPYQKRISKGKDFYISLDEKKRLKTDLSTAC